MQEALTNWGQLIRQSQHEQTTINNLVVNKTDVKGMLNTLGEALGVCGSKAER